MLCSMLLREPDARTAWLQHFSYGPLLLNLLQAPQPSVRFCALCMVAAFARNPSIPPPGWESGPAAAMGPGPSTAGVAGVPGGGGESSIAGWTNELCTLAPELLDKITQLVLQQLHAVLLARQLGDLVTAAAGANGSKSEANKHSHSSSDSNREAEIGHRSTAGGADEHVTNQSSSSSSSFSGAGSGGKDQQDLSPCTVPSAPVSLCGRRNSLEEGTSCSAEYAWVQQAAVAGAEYQTLCLDYGSIALWGLNAAASAMHSPQSALGSLTAVGQLLGMYLGNTSSTNSSSSLSPAGSSCCRTHAFGGKVLPAVGKETSTESISSAAVCSLCLSLCATASCSSLVHEAVAEQLQVLGDVSALKQQLQPLFEGLKGVLLMDANGPEVSSSGV